VKWVSLLANLDIALNAVEMMVKRKKGYGLQPTEKNLLLSPLKGVESLEEELEKLTLSQQDVFKSLYGSALYGFFHCAADGYEFVPATRICLSLYYNLLYAFCKDLLDFQNLNF